MKVDVIHGSRRVPRDEAKALLVSVSENFRANQLRGRLERARHRNAHLPRERQSVAVAMLAVEDRLVRAFWTIARLPLTAAPQSARRWGLVYYHDDSDTMAGYADAAGGKWDSLAPRPALPSAKAIDDATAVLDWLLLCDDVPLRRVLVIGATSKRGDAGRKVNWIRVRAALPELSKVSRRTLQRRYEDALRCIVAGLTLARVA